MATGDTALRLTRANSEYLDITSSPPDHNSDYSISFWLYLVATGVRHEVILVKSASGNEVDSLVINAATNKLEIWAQNGGSYLSEKGSTVLSGSTWYHVSYSRSGDDIAVYLNGVAETFGDYTLAVSGRGASTLMRLGATAAIDDYADLRVKGLVIHERALTASQVAAQMAQNAPLDATDLYAYWPFDDGDVTDHSGHGHDWTAYNTPTVEEGPGIPLGTSSALLVPPSAAVAGTTVTPGLAELVLTGYAPTVSVSGNVTVTPANATLEIVGYAPTVTATESVTAVPGIATLSITTYAPTVTFTDNVTVSPAPATLEVVGYAPTIGVGESVTVVPGTASMTLTTYAPTVTTTENVTVTPAPASLAITTYEPTVTTSVGLTVTPDAAALVITTYAPTVTATGSLPITLTPDAAALVVTTYAPTVTSSVPASIMTCGVWSQDISFAECDEWSVVLTGPSATNAKVRVVLTFEDQ